MSNTVNVSIDSSAFGGGGGTAVGGGGGTTVPIEKPHVDIPTIARLSNLQQCTSEDLFQVL